MDRRRKEALRLVLEGKAAGEIAKLVEVREETVRKWFADPEFIARARKEIANECILLIPDILGRLKGLIQEGSDTAAVQAIKVVVRLWEGVSAEDEEKRVIESLIDIIDKALDELDIHPVEQSIVANERPAETVPGGEGISDGE